MLLQVQRVHHGPEHAHVVGVHAVHAAAAGRAAPEVARADDDRDFDALVEDEPDAFDDGFHGVFAVRRGGVALEGLAAQLEEDSVELAGVVHGAGVLV